MFEIDTDSRSVLCASWSRDPFQDGKEGIEQQTESEDGDLEIQLSYAGRPTCESKSNSLQAVPSGGQHAESSSAYLIWPPSARHNGSAEERAYYFSGLQKSADLGRDHRISSGHQATTLLDLMTIRAFHTKALRRYSLGAALGFRTRGGTLTNIPAIVVFVGRKMHKEWLLDVQRLPSTLQGPGGVWCDVDVVEFSYYGAPKMTPKEQLYTELVEGLRGNDPCIGAGSQVASQVTYGTLGGVVRSKTAGHQLGFLTNRHVAVDLDYPNQKMFHPLPPSLGPGVYLGAVERATSFITDDLWYGVFAGMNPETFVRVDGAFIPFTDTFDLTKLTASLKGVGEMGEVMRADLQAPIDSVIGKRVMKVGRSSGLTRGVIMAFAVEYNDERGICYFTDLLVVGENGQPFDLEGDSGSLILLVGEEHEKPRPLGIIWGGTANRGRLKLRSGYGPENWTSGVDLGRLLDLLQLELITTRPCLLAAIDEHRRHHHRTERIERGNSVGGWRGDEENRTGHSTSQTHETGGVDESENAQSPDVVVGEENLSRFTDQEWRIGMLAPAAGDSFDSCLPLGAPREGLQSSSIADGKGRIEGVELGLGLGDRDAAKRRRFT